VLISFFILAISSTVFVHVHLLAADTVYEFRVLAETKMGTGPFSPSRNFTTLENGISYGIELQLEFQFPMRINLIGSFI